MARYAHIRAKYRSRSNNPVNPNKNVCAYVVAQGLGVGDATRYLHTWSDLARAIRTRWGFRSVRSYVTKQGDTMGKIRKGIDAHAKENPRAVAYVVRVDGHVLALKRDGSTVVDTDPRKRDKRKVLDVYAVYKQSIFG